MACHVMACGGLCGVQGSDSGDFDVAVGIADCSWLKERAGSTAIQPMLCLNLCLSLRLAS